MEKVEQIQYQAALAVTGAWQGTSRVKVYEELGWESLSDRRMSRRVLQLFKIVDRKTPNYLHEKLPENRIILIDLPDVFRNIRCRTDRYSKSFFPDATSNWNKIITSFDNLPSFEVLKGHLVSLIRPENKSMFNIHDPLHRRYLFQLRMGLSPLRYHKKRHNFSDTPSEICLCGNGEEDTAHFLLLCPLFVNQRTYLTDLVEEIIGRTNLVVLNHVDLYLYSHPSLNFADNQKDSSCYFEVY